MEETFKLSDLMNTISAVIDADFGGPYWITAELAAAHQKGKGYWVLELQESDESGQKLAQTQAMVWAHNVPRVVYRFQNATGQKLSAGMRVRIHVQASFHPQWGFRLTVDNIDTDWTLGEAQANNEKIRKKLKNEGVWGKNQSLVRPNDFFSIAIVSPDTSAGLEDFLREAEVLKAYGLLDYDVFIAPFEGPNSLKGIPAALNKAVASKKPYDAVCMVRGGGAAAGIAWLNQEEIVRAVCECPIPVLSGIGHERDSTLVDEVSNIVCGTPSKTIGLVGNVIIQNAQMASNSWVEFQREVEQRLLVAHQRLGEHLNTVSDITNNLLSRARSETEGLMREAIGLGPLATLSRGYALVKNQKGQLVKSVNDVSADTKVTISLSDGEIQAVVSTGQEKPNEKSAPSPSKNKTSTSKKSRKSVQTVNQTIAGDNNE